jgi:CheY-like chemotaxis protein/anti-sigma regulatory factor (Ser/Thr protein kinase)
VTPALAGGVGRVLIVDDDPVSRELMIQVARRAGHDAVPAETVADARECLECDGTGAYDCVVTDYAMPDASGLDLLGWVRERDLALSVVMITANDERDLLAATLRGGATNFLDKPVPADAFRGAVLGAMTATRRLRKLDAAQRSTHAIGRMQRHVMHAGAAGRERLVVRHLPLGEAGGDFVTALNLPGGAFVLIAADVSGHDLSAAYTAAYFQGLVRGMLESGSAVAEVMARFNALLADEWVNAGGDGTLAVNTSVATAAVCLQAGGLTGSVTNAGFPSPTLISHRGSITVLEDARSSPLGWFADEVPTSAMLSVSSGDLLLLWTDGLEDVAERRGLCPLAIATAMLREPDGRVPGITEHLLDDVLLVAMPLGAVDMDAAQASPIGGRWLPVARQEFSGADSVLIDSMQLCWQRCLALALPEIAESRALDALLATREGVLNAMRHGCGGCADAFGTLEIAFDADTRILRVMITDPGPGHDFDFRVHEATAGDELVDAHRGLSLMHQLSSTIVVERRGAQVRLDFRY